VLSRFAFITEMRLRGRAAIAGGVFAGTLVLSLGLFFLLGNHSVVRVLFFPSDTGTRLVAEQRFVPRSRGLEGQVGTLVDDVLLGPMNPDAVRLFPRGVTVNAVLIQGRTAYLDLSQRLLAEDPEIPLHGKAALDALERSIRFNFPRLHEVVISIDGQPPRFPDQG